MNPTVDSGPKLPRQIVAQHAAALALQKAGEEPPPSDPPAADPPPPAPAVPPAFTVEQLLNAPDPAKDSSRDYWHARAQAVEGFRREDNARAARKIQALEAQIEDLTTKNTALVNSQPAMQTPIDLSKHFTEDEIESIGHDRATAILRASTQAAEKLIKEKVDAAVKPLLTQRTEAAEMNLQEKKRQMIADLDAGFPTWRVTDNDPRWLQDYLSRVEPTTGMTYQEILNGHKANFNGKGIVKMLNSFVLSLSPVAVPAVPPVTPPTLRGDGGDAPPNPDPGAGDGRVLTAAEITEGYQRKVHSINGKPKFTDDESRLFDARVTAQMNRAGRG